MKRIKGFFKKHIYDMIFSLPALIIYIIFFIIPIMVCFYYSFTNWNGISEDYKFVGIKNFINVFQDRAFIDSLKTTLIIAIITTVLLNVLGILLAVILNHIGRTYKICKSLIFIPAILSSVVVSFIWSYMTQTDGGVINIILSYLKVSSIDLYQSHFSITVLVSIVISWASLGFYTTVYDATLKTIPTELYEAGDIDGANGINKFFYITLPLLMPGVTICTMLSIIWALKQYDFVKIMTPGIVETVTVTALEKAFEYNMYGYSSAMILILSTLIVLASGVQGMISKSQEVDY